MQLVFEQFCFSVDFSFLFTELMNHGGRQHILPLFCIKCNNSTEVFSFKCVSLFVICKTIDLSIEKICTLKKLGSGDLVEVNSTKQSKLQIKNIFCYCHAQ